MTQQPTTKTIKRLFAASGNRCAFPGCDRPLVTGETVTGEICHIRARSPGGPRYDPAQTAADRHAFENLLLLCGDHHKIIDADPAAYTVERLLQYKTDRETHSTPAPAPTDNIANQLLRQINIGDITGQVGVIGDHAHVEGGIHFHQAPSSPPPPVSSAPSPPIPLQRPQPVEHFTDRETELAQLLADLQPGRVVTLCGPGGIGKTALAAEALWTLAPGQDPPDRFPDGIIFHSFYNQPQAVLALESIARACGEEPRPTPRDAAQRALAGRRALLLLDGTEEADDLRAVLNVRGGCGVLVTSRARRDAAAEPQDVKPLEADDAVALLRKWGGDRAADTEAAARVCETVGYLPLAVRLVGRYLAQTGESAPEYLHWLSETPLDALDQGQRRLESVSVLLEKSLAQVGGEACRVLAIVGCLALAPFRRAPIAAALDLSPHQLRQPLGQLVSYGLLTRLTSPPEGGIEGGTRYEVSHALVHTYARERARPEAETLQRLAGYYDALALEQRELGLPGYRRLDIERAHLMRVLAGCAERAQWEAVSSLVWAVDGYLDICGYSTEGVQALEMGVKAAGESGRRYDEGAFLSHLGLVYNALGQVEKSIEFHKQALAVRQEIGYRQGEGADLGNLGNAYRNLGEVGRAVEYYEQALAISREIGDRRNEGNWLGNLGNAYFSLGEVGRAVEYYEQALAIAREIGDRRGEGAHLGNLGGAYYRLGEVGRAVEYYEQALAIAREIGDRRNEGNWLANTGLLLKEQGDLARARELWEQALRIYEAIQDPNAERVRGWLAE